MSLHDTEVVFGIPTHTQLHVHVTIRVSQLCNEELNSFRCHRYHANANATCFLELKAETWERTAGR